MFPQNRVELRSEKSDSISVDLAIDCSQIVAIRRVQSEPYGICTIHMQGGHVFRVYGDYTKLTNDLKFLP
jgi:hypothetical protein